MKRSKPLQLIIALEPEAAGLYCATMKMQDFVENPAHSKEENKLSEEGTQFLVADCGGKQIDQPKYL